MNLLSTFLSNEDVSLSSVSSDSICSDVLVYSPRLTTSSIARSSLIVLVTFSLIAGSGIKSLISSGFSSINSSLKLNSSTSISGLISTISSFLDILPTSNSSLLFLSFYSKASISASVL